MMKLDVSLIGWDDCDQTPLFIPGLGFSFHNSYLYFESVSSPDPIPE